jgi:hypothetical protein
VVKRSSKPRDLSLLALLTFASACSQILDIEQAHVDPTLLGNAGSSQAGSQPAGSSNSELSSAGQHEAGEAGSGSGGTHDHTGGGSAGSGTAGSTAGSGGNAPVELGLCERYCEQVTSSCKGKYEQYRSFEQCIRVCQRLPPGEPDDEQANTVSCRLRQAEHADGEPFLYCKSAGPLGEGKCGSNCVSYCSLMQESCTAESTAKNLELSFYESSQACLSACTALPETPGTVYYSSSMSSDPPTFVGNTVFCRTYHVAAALEDDEPDEHCPHAMGGDPCIAE